LFKREKKNNKILEKTKNYKNAGGKVKILITYTTKNTKKNLLNTYKKIKITLKTQNSINSPRLLILKYTHINGTFP